MTCVCCEESPAECECEECGASMCDECYDAMVICDDCGDEDFDEAEEL